MYLIFAVFLRSVCISMLSTVSLERPKHTNPSRICWAMLWGRVISVSALSTASTIHKHIDGQSCQERVRQIGTLMGCPARVYWFLWLRMVERIQWFPWWNCHFARSTSEVCWKICSRGSMLFWRVLSSTRYGSCVFWSVQKCFALWWMDGRQRSTRAWLMPRNEQCQSVKGNQALGACLICTYHYITNAHCGSSARWKENDRVMLAMLC